MYLFDSAHWIDRDVKEDQRVDYLIPARSEPFKVISK